MATIVLDRLYYAPSHRVTKTETKLGGTPVMLAKAIFRRAIH